MRFQLTGKVAVLVLLSLIISGCAKDSCLPRWGQCALAGGGIAGGLGGIAGAANGSVAGPISAAGGAIIGGIICAMSGEKEAKTVSAQPKQEEVVVVVEEPPKLPPVTEHLGYVLFAFDSDKLSPEYKEKLKQVAETARKEKDMKIVLNGFTDSTGSVIYNKDLARRRARSVKLYLRETLKLPRVQIIMGAGGVIERDNETKQDRAQNRRVNIIGTHADEDPTDPPASQ